MLLLRIVCVQPLFAQKGDPAIAEQQLQKVLDSLYNHADKGSIEKSLLLFTEGLELEKQMSGPTRISADLHKNFAGFLHRNGALQLAIQHEKIALSQIEKIEGLHPGETQYYLLGMIGSSFFVEEKFDSALWYYRKAVDIAAKVNDVYLLAAGKNNVGMLFQRSGRPDSALIWFNEALAFAELPDVHDSSMAISVADNLAELYYQKGEYDLALKYYERNLAVAQKLKNTLRIMQARLGIAEVYLKLRQNAKAYPLLLWADNNIEAIRNHDRYNEFLIRLKWDYVTYYSAIGDHAETDKRLADVKSELHKKSLERELFLDEALNNFMQISIKKIEHELDMQNALLKAETEQNRLNRWVLILTFVTSLSFILVIWFGLRRRVSAQKRKIEFEKLNGLLNATKLKNKELEATQLKFELEHKKRDLEGVALHSSLSMKISHDILERLKEISKLTGNEAVAEIRKYVSQIQLQLQADEKNTVLVENIGEVNQQFFHTLKKAFPNLTPSEVELCGLIRLNMSGKEISNLRNISPASVKMGRNRLRKKLGLSPETDLYDFIISFATTHRNS